MINFLNNEKKMFVEFFSHSKMLLSVTAIFMFFSYGIKVIYFDYSIDTEAIMSSYSEQMYSWLKVDRLSLVFTKYLLFHHLFNPFVANFLTFFTFTVVCFLLSYLIVRILKIHAKKAAIVIFSILFLTDPIFAEQFNFTLQNFEVSLAILFLVVALFSSYYYILTYRITFAIVSVLLSVWSFLTYQSLYSFYIAGALASFILIVYSHQRGNQVRKFKVYFTILLIYALIFLLSFILSQLVAYIYTKAAHIPSSSYLTGQILWGKKTVIEVLRSIKSEIATVILARNMFYNYGFLFSDLAIGIIFIKKIIQRNKSVYLEIIGFICLLISPFLLTIILGQGEAIRAQMPALEFVIAFNFYYIYLHLQNNLIKRAFVIVCFIIAFNQGYSTANLLVSEHMKYDEDVTLANRINFQLDSMGIGDRKNYALVILGKHEPESVVNIQGETLGHSFFAWDLGTKQGTTYRVVNFMRIQGYLFHIPTVEQMDYAHSIQGEMGIFPDKNSIRVVKNLVIVKLSN